MVGSRGKITAWLPVENHVGLGLDACPQLCTVVLVLADPAACRWMKT